MLFNSIEFLLFFPTVVVLYFLIASQYRWVLLLVASYYFYMAWKPAYILLIVVSTIIDYWCSRRMGELPDKQQRKPYLYVSLAANLGILFTFKYFDFFNQSLGAVSEALGLGYVPASWELILPMGISFYTFQTMSYSIDVYHGKLAPEKHFGKFALFVTFFPQLVAGPIERATHLLPQFHQKFDFNYYRITSGLRQMGWGMFKKVVIADRLSVLVNAVYNQPGDFEGFFLALATVFFAFQIYCDFSGYSDIAIGAARVLGFDLMRNFRTPYFAKTISEFWRRWHISLSTWFRDYVYIPLGGSRTVKWRWYYNLFITFAISGLWHGANWTFVIWGALHGFYLIASIWAQPIKTWVNRITRLDQAPLVMKWVDVLVVFVLVNLAWVFFRANSASDAFYILTHFLDGKSADFTLFAQEMLNLVRGQADLGAKLMAASGANLGLSLFEFLIAIAAIGFLVLTEWAYSRTNLPKLVEQSPLLVRWSIYYAMVYGILLFRYVGINEFIYFQF